MFSWLTDLVTKVGETGSEVSPIGELFSIAFEPPFSYFIGLVLIASIIMIVKNVARKRA